MPKFQMVNRKRKNSNDCQLTGMGISSSLLLFFCVIVQVKIILDCTLIYLISGCDQIKKNPFLQNRKFHNSVKTNFQPRVLKELNRLIVPLLHGWEEEKSMTRSRYKLSLSFGFFKT